MRNKLLYTLEKMFGWDICPAMPSWKVWTCATNHSGQWKCFRTIHVKVTYKSATCGHKPAPAQVIQFNKNKENMHLRWCFATTVGLLGPTCFTSGRATWWSPVTDSQSSCCCCCQSQSNKQANPAPTLWLWLWFWFWFWYQGFGRHSGFCKEH